jgi:hypothetical protein
VPPLVVLLLLLLLLLLHQVELQLPWARWLLLTPA